MDSTTYFWMATAIAGSAAAILSQIWKKRAAALGGNPLKLWLAGLWKGERGARYRPITIKPKDNLVIRILPPYGIEPQFKDHYIRNAVVRNPLVEPTEKMHVIGTGWLAKAFDCPIQLESIYKTDAGSVRVTLSATKGTTVKRIIVGDHKRPVTCHAVDGITAWMLQNSAFEFGPFGCAESVGEMDQIIVYYNLDGNRAGVMFSRHGLAPVWSRRPIAPTEQNISLLGVTHTLESKQLSINVLDSMGSIERIIVNVDGGSRSLINWPWTKLGFKPITGRLEAKWIDSIDVEDVYGMIHSFVHTAQGWVDNKIFGESFKITSAAPLGNCVRVEFDRKLPGIISAQVQNKEEGWLLSQTPHMKMSDKSCSIADIPVGQPLGKVERLRFVMPQRDDATQRAKEQYFQKIDGKWIRETVFFLKGSTQNPVDADIAPEPENSVVAETATESESPVDVEEAFTASNVTNIRLRFKDGHKLKRIVVLDSAGEKIGIKDYDLPTTHYPQFTAGVKCNLRSGVASKIYVYYEGRQGLGFVAFEQKQGGYRGPIWIKGRPALASSVFAAHKDLLIESYSLQTKGGTTLDLKIADKLGCLKAIIVDTYGSTTRTIDQLTEHKVYLGAPPKWIERVILEDLIGNKYKFVFNENLDLIPRDQFYYKEKVGVAKVERKSEEGNAFADRLIVTLTGILNNPQLEVLMSNGERLDWSGPPTTTDGTSGTRRTVINVSLGSRSRLHEGVVRVGIKTSDAKAYRTFRCYDGSAWLPPLLPVSIKWQEPVPLCSTAVEKSKKSIAGFTVGDRVRIKATSGSGTSSACNKDKKPVRIGDIFEIVDVGTVGKQPVVAFESFPGSCTTYNDLTGQLLSREGWNSLDCDDLEKVEPVAADEGAKQSSGIKVGDWVRVKSTKGSRTITAMNRDGKRPEVGDEYEVIDVGMYNGDLAIIHGYRGQETSYQNQSGEWITKKDAQSLDLSDLEVSVPRNKTASSEIKAGDRIRVKSLEFSMTQTAIDETGNRVYVGNEYEVLEVAETSRRRCVVIAGLERRQCTFGRGKQCLDLEDVEKVKAKDSEAATV